MQKFIVLFLLAEDGEYKGNFFSLVITELFKSGITILLPPLFCFNNILFLFSFSFSFFFSFSSFVFFCFFRSLYLEGEGNTYLRTRIDNVLDNCLSCSLVEYALLGDDDGEDDCDEKGVLLLLLLVLILISSSFVSSSYFLLGVEYGDISSVLLLLLLLLFFKKKKKKNI